MLMYMNPAPARMPNALLMMVRQGIVIIAATYFGASTNSIGSIAMVRSASISLVTTMVPISAENADPDRPLTTKRRQQRAQFAREPDRHGVHDVLQRSEPPQFGSDLHRQDESRTHGHDPDHR